MGVTPGRRRRRRQDNGRHRPGPRHGPRQAILGAVALCVVAVLCTVDTATDVPAEAAGRAVASPPVISVPLGHAGRWITDRQGRVVILHGFNMVDKRAPYEPAAAGFGDADAAFLEKEGFDAVRVGVLFEAVEPAPGVFSSSYVHSIEKTVNTLGRHGIVSLLDFHQDAYSERFDGEGFPEWAVADDALALEPQKNNWALNEESMPAVWAAYSSLWADVAGPGGVGLQQRYAAAWAFVAARFRSNANVFGYELMNEPFPGTGYQACAARGCPSFDATLTRFYRLVDRAIRAVDRHTLVFVEPSVLFDFYAPTHLGAVDRDGGFAFHPYCQGAVRACADGVAGDFAAAERYAATHHSTLLVTEFGATDAAGALQLGADAADASMVGWLEWSFWNHDPAPSGSDATTLIVHLDRPPTGDNVRWGDLRALARPYPQAVAGTPLGFGYDTATHLFHLTWSTAKAGGGRFGPRRRTVIELPAPAYPHGYGARVDGGRILSRSGARHLVVGACAGVRTVSVTVRSTGPDRATC